MPVPAFQELFLPILTYIADGKEHAKQDVAEHLSQKLQLTPDELSELLPSGKQTKFLNRIAWCRRAFNFDHLCSLNFDQV